MLKKIDKLLVTSFFGPYIVTFFIALFVLVMQMLWLYIDDIAGKGVGFLLLIELIGYMSISFFPLALAIAVLISSVMVLGNLAEHYELSSLKSAGVPLFRTMMPLLGVVFCVSVFSFFCSNNFIPVSNLKFKSRLYDIRRQKPTLNLAEGAFNDDFKGFSIRIGNKGADNRTIEDVLIYDQTEASKGGKMTVISAAKGEMYVTPDEKFFIMELRDGMQSYEPAPTGNGKEKNAPFSRTYFKSWTKVFDLGEFEMQRTDAGLFKSHHSMLTIAQLSTAIDSIDDETAERERRLYEQSLRFFYPLKAEDDRRSIAEAKQKREEKEAKEKVTQGVDFDKYMSDAPVKVNPKDIKKSANKYEKKQDDKKKTEKRTPPKPVGRQPLPQTIDKPLTEYTTFAELFDKKDRVEMYDKAKSYARTVQGQAESAARTIDRIRINRVKHVFEFHSKFSTAAACLIFLFIGAPMGAIVRKGGFGYPLLISIIFFMLFMVITIFSKNIAERAVIDATLAAWMNCIILAPFGIVLTYAAMTDKRIVNFDKVGVWFGKVKAWVVKKGVKKTENTEPKKDEN